MENVIRKTENPAKVFLRRYRALVIQRDSLQRSIDEAYDRATSSTGRLREVKVSSRLLFVLLMVAM